MLSIGDQGTSACPGILHANTSETLSTARTRARPYLRSRHTIFIMSVDAAVVAETLRAMERASLLNRASRDCDPADDGCRRLCASWCSRCKQSQAGLVRRVATALDGFMARSICLSDDPRDFGSRCGRHLRSRLLYGMHCRRWMREANTSSAAAATSNSAEPTASVPASAPNVAL